MANQWFRMYHEFATDPKVQMLSEVDQRRYIMLLCLRCCNGDVTLHVDEVAFQLRIGNDEMEATKQALVAKGLVDEALNPTSWDKRQYLSDSSAARVAKHRAKKKQVGNVTVTPPDTEADTDIKKKNSSSGDEATPSLEEENPKNEKYRTKNKRSLSGQKLKDFLLFWESFGYMKGKAAAADSWIDIADYSADLVEKIVSAATIEAMARPALSASGSTPKWAQGWLTGKRWEDDDLQGGGGAAPRCNVCDYLRRGDCQGGKAECRSFRQAEGAVPMRVVGGNA